eukprot:854153-Alexandrium_andersonii.AAC.2
MLFLPGLRARFRRRGGTRGGPCAPSGAPAALGRPEATRTSRTPGRPRRCLLYTSPSPRD